MEVSIDFTKSAQENANSYYQNAKKYHKKSEGAAKAMTQMEEKLNSIESEHVQQAAKTKTLHLQKKEWYEKFHWFFTSHGSLAIGGRDAQQNELLNSKHFDENDLFFHADIFGASVVILKGGAGADKEEKAEVAAFAASYSSAWKKMLVSVDVYAMRRDQISKSTNKGSLGQGSFLMKGEREWYRNTPLGIAMYVMDGKLHTVPLKTAERQKPSGAKLVMIRLGSMIKSDAAKSISKMLGYENTDDIIQQMPAGTFEISMA
ncbi:MAG: NFACT RNA binding domain-containing protein [Candidatus Micrarchaeales archaeon]|jgi:predicted ribosome quality control (RQC) complex YloA/Tae2 family protein|uniref:NFACT RNA-binding domain-containing protein n=1 Tax=Candidatus Micrarchaeum acidiphilum ARMAN-2 TaxID=425595 RepID=C7DGN1_MICA2|nr:MAG: protein of unknown function DUF814 [Candidatus Micrarchaeum acidiphilum ARMAN-2]MCW6161215.1 NFACT RNA binding domain-containing protein [Candidatus Micrarchaeales archaeon]